MTRRNVLVPALALVFAFAVAACGSSSSNARAPTTMPSATTTTIVTGPVTLTSQAGASPLYTQGVARVAGGWIFSGNNWLIRASEQAERIRMVSPAIPEGWAAQGYNHIGDIDVVGDYIYAPFEQPNYEKGTQATARYKSDTMTFVDAIVVHQHENSFVTVDPDTMIAYSADRFDGKSLLRYDVAHAWKPMPPLAMNMVLHRTQGADIAHGAVWISTDDAVHGLYRVDLATGATTLVGKMGHADGEGEGIDATDLPSGLLHTLCIDKTHKPVWFAHWRARTS